MNGAHALYPHVSYSSSLDRYFMFFSVNQWQEPMNNRPAILSGIYMAHSADGLAWSEPIQLVADYSYPQPGKSISWEASLIWDDDGGGRRGWLVYGYSPRWGHAAIGGTPHYLVGRRISFERAVP